MKIFTRRKDAFEGIYGGQNSNELQDILADVDSLATEEGKRIVEGKLRDFDTSHDALAQRITLLIDLKDDELARNVAVRGIALYPYSSIMISRFLRVFGSELTRDQLQILSERREKYRQQLFEELKHT